MNCLFIIALALAIMAFLCFRIWRAKLECSFHLTTTANMLRVLPPQHPAHRIAVHRREEAIEMGIWKGGS